MAHVPGSPLARLLRLLRELLGGPSAVPPGAGLVGAGPPGAARETVECDLQVRAETPASPDGDRPEGAETASDAVRRFRVGVDDGGELVVCAGDRIVLGHLRAGEAHLPFLADVGARHARIRASGSLSAGPTWSLEPIGAERVRIDGRMLTGSATLRDTNEVVLGDNLAFRVRVPDPSSGSIVLDLLHGAECCGALRVVLMAQGPAGRLRIGSSGGRHVRVAGLEHEIGMVLEGERLLLVCEAGIEGAGPQESGRFALPCPPPQRVDLLVGRSAGGRPPFGLSIGPIETPGGGSPGAGLVVPGGRG